MEKVIRDGLVAVLYAPGFGAGWFSWHDIEDLVYDPVVVDMVEREEDPDNIVKYCVSKYSDSTLLRWCGSVIYSVASSRYSIRD
jgi:hypothetical protein